MQPSNIQQKSKPRATPLRCEVLEERAMLTVVSQLVDIYPGPVTSTPQSFEVLNGVAYFSAGGGALWKTDGTPAGTAIVSTVDDAGPVAGFGTTAVVNGSLFYVAKRDGLFELWKSDGTGAGTVLVKGFSSDFADLALMGSVGGTVFLRAYDKTFGDELWKSDGTPAGTGKVHEINPNLKQLVNRDILLSSVNFHNRLFFTANDGVHGYELWTSDGTPQGTAMLANIVAGSGSAEPGSFFEWNGSLFFSAFGSNAPLGGKAIQGLWKTDGTPAGTTLVIDFGGIAANLMSLNGKMIFYTGGSGGVWTSDGTTSGTVQLKSINVQSPLANVNGTIFFAADDGIHGAELWKTDGTAAGTVMVKDINLTTVGLAPAGSDISSLTNVNGMLFFAANDGIAGNELWLTDGTDAGTTLASDIYPGRNVNLVPASSQPGDLRNVNGHLVFTADDGIHGRELWIATNVTNGAPFAPGKNLTAVEDTPLQVTLVAIDADNDPLTYSVVDQPQHGTLSGTAPNVTYTPNGGYVGPDSFTFRANDGTHDSNRATISITVISNYPVAKDVVAKTKAHKSVAVNLDASDPRNLPLTYTIVDGPSHGTLSGTAPNLTYTPALDYIGLDGFTYQVRNGQSSSNVGAASINVTPNHAPVVSDETFLIFATANITLSELAGDEDGDPLTYTVLSQPDHGTLSGTPPNLTYTPVASVNPTVTFTYQASDGEAVSNVGTITLLIISAKLRVNAEDGAHTEPDWAHTIFPNVPPGGDPSLLFKPIAINTSLFTTQPEIDSTGRLTFTPASNSQGTTRVMVTKSTAPAGGEGETASGDETADFLIEIDQKAPWQNDNNDDDVDNDGNVAPIDALLVIDYLNGIGSGGITSWSSEGPFFDTSGDNIVSPEDALLVINVVNAGIFDGPLLAEGESTITTLGFLGLPAGPPRSSDATSAGPPPTLLTTPTPTTTDSDLLNLLALDSIQATSQRRKA